MTDIDFKKILADKKSLERILNSLSEGIIAHDMNRNILFFNDSAEKITGYRRKEVIGRNCHEVFGEPFCGGRCSFKNIIPSTKITDKSYPLNILTKGGKTRRVDMKVTGMNDDNGNIAGVIAAFQDITDLLSLKIQKGDIQGFSGIIGNDPQMIQIYRQIRELSTTDYPVTIFGETGTGKELVANAVHNESRRGGGPFVPINCAALPEGILESELFGHMKGSFTGAVKDKKGRFDLADGGTLFLDEIGDMPKIVQAKLLRVLQDGTFERVGGEKTIKANVRIISATNKDLKTEMEKGNFREDLYYRINVVPIDIPPLRKRRGDIKLIVEYFMNTALSEGEHIEGISKDALEIMENYNWPGNIRELQSALRFALLKSRGKSVLPEHLPLELKKWDSNRPSKNPGRKLEPENVQAALLQTGGNKAKAARLLKVGRATLYRFFAEHPDIT